MNYLINFLIALPDVVIILAIVFFVGYLITDNPPVKKTLMSAGIFSVIFAVLIALQSPTIKPRNTVDKLPNAVYNVEQPAGSASQLENRLLQPESTEVRTERLNKELTAVQESRKILENK